MGRNNICLLHIQKVEGKKTAFFAYKDDAVVFQYIIAALNQANQTSHKHGTYIRC